MIKRITIGFLLSILILVVSEYILLKEVYSNKQPFIILFSVMGIILGSAFFIFFFNKYRKASDES